MSAEPAHRLRRTEASKYLKDRWGIHRAPSTLAKLACIGGGPLFEKCGRMPLYTPDHLDQWAKSMLSPPLRSTSDPGQQFLTDAVKGFENEFGS